MRNIIKAYCHHCKLEIPQVKDRSYVYQPAEFGTAYHLVAVCLNCFDAHFPDTCDCCAYRYKRDRFCKIIGVCQRCQKRLQQSVYNNRRKAKQQGVNYDLSLEGWVSILRAFNYRCAYCNAPSNGLMEHFVPVALGGATSVNNCVPACHTCNSMKRDKDPNSSDFRCSIPKADMERVRQYLATR